MVIAWTDPRTWAADELVNEDLMNVQVRDNFDYLYEHIPVCLVYEDQKASGTDGGTFSSGAWRTRTLNTEVSDAGGHGSLSSNQVTLVAGEYVLWAQASAYDVDHHQLQWYNISDSSVELLGLNTHSETSDAVPTTAIIQGTFTIAASKTFELRHRCKETKSSLGFGKAADWGTEIYAHVMLMQL